MLALLLVLALGALFASGSRGVLENLSAITSTDIQLDPRLLPGYAARSGGRMLLALVLSLLFTSGYATFAARALIRRAPSAPLKRHRVTCFLLGIAAAATCAT